MFVDTPGFNSATQKLSEGDILKMVADWLKSTYLFVAVDNFNIAYCFFLDIVRMSN